MKQRSFLLLLIYAYMYIYLQIAGYTKPGLRQYEAILPLLDQEISQSLQEGSLSESLKQPQISTLFFNNK